jgi:hypothetical protein
MACGAIGNAASDGDTVGETTCCNTGAGGTAAGEAMAANVTAAGIGNATGPVSGNGTGAAS